MRNGDKEARDKLILHNLKYIRKHLDKNTGLILILGSEIDTFKTLEGYEGVCEKNIVLNKYIREFAKEYDNIAIVEITDYITSDDDYSECINHFSRNIYAKLAGKIIEFANKQLGSNHLFLKAGD